MDPTFKRDKYGVKSKEKDKLYSQIAEPELTGIRASYKLWKRVGGTMDDMHVNSLSQQNELCEEFYMQRKKVLGSGEVGRKVHELRGCLTE